MTSAKDPEARGRNKLEDMERDELFDRIITSHAINGRWALARQREKTHRPGHSRFKGIVLLGLIAGGFFVLASELPTIQNFLDGFDCGIVSYTGSVHSVAVINAVEQSMDADLNTTFGQIARSAGYGFDFYGFREAGVNFFLHLPEKSYSVILILSHGSAGAIVTSDPYSSTQWVGAQLSDKVTQVSVDGTNGQYFALTPQFVSQMCGDFHGGLVMVLGCAAMENTEIAAAFVNKGANAFVGWDNGVTMLWMVKAAEMSLHLLLNGSHLGEAVNSVMGAIGPDPIYRSQLLYYPEGASSYHLASGV